MYNLKNCQVGANSVIRYALYFKLSSGNIFPKREINKEVDYQQSSVLSSEQAAFLRLWSNVNVGKNILIFFKNRVSF